MRKGCYDCARKHLAQACVQVSENLKGYFPTWGWLAVGHLAEAEDELLEFEVALANDIRAHRVEYIRWLNGELDEVYRIPFESLIEKVTSAFEVYMASEREPVNQGFSKETES